MPKPLLAVLHGEKPSRRPLWLMRQAGRYLPEYRKVRDTKGGFLDLCYDPEAAAEVTLQPLKRYDFDASIVFADILVIADAMGINVSFAAGEGPIVEIVDTEKQVAKLRSVRGSRQVEQVCATLRLVSRALPRDVALIGFCGAPWTVASYMVEGGSSPERLKARLAAAQNQSWFAAMVERLIGESVDYLEAQVKAGAEAVQIFDSWAGDLSWDLQERWVYEPLRKLVEGFRTRCPGIPVIVFARGVGAGHSAVAETVKPNALSLEPGVPLDWAGRVLSPLVSLQGNLDPVALVAGGDVLSRAVNKIVKALPAQKHIFNLGHGVRPETSPGHVEELVRLVRKADD